MDDDQNDLIGGEVEEMDEDIPEGDGDDDDMGVGDDDDEVMGGGDDE